MKVAVLFFAMATLTVRKEISLRGFQMLSKALSMKLIGQNRFILLQEGKLSYICLADLISEIESFLEDLCSFGSIFLNIPVF